MGVEMRLIPQFIAMRLLSVSASLAQECPAGMQGTEASHWSIDLDFQQRTFRGDMAEPRKTKAAAIIDLSCSGSSISFRQRDASDGNDCSYHLTRNGGSISGTETCTNPAGTFPVSGT